MPTQFTDTGVRGFTRRASAVDAGIVPGGGPVKGGMNAQANAQADAKADCQAQGGTYNAGANNPCMMPDEIAAQTNCITYGGIWQNGTCADFTQAAKDCTNMGGTYANKICTPAPNLAVSSGMSMTSYLMIGAAAVAAVLIIKKLKKKKA